jgi:GDP-L-fucose synthase
MGLFIMINSSRDLHFKLKKGVYLVAGATGMIGSHTLELLANQDGIQVIAIFNKRKKNIFAENITYVNADLTNEKVCLKLAHQVDFILMYAAIKSHASVDSIDPIYSVKKSLEIANNMFYAAYKNKVKKLVWLSSLTGYPESIKSLHEDDMFDENPPDYWYAVGWMTRYLETQCKMYAEKLKDPIDIIVLRPSLVYGEFDNFSSESGTVIAALIYRVVNRINPLEIWGDGNQLRDLIYAKDIASIALEGITSLVGYNVLNIGEGESYSLNHILSLLLKLDNYDDVNIIYKKNKIQASKQILMSVNKAENIGLKPTTSLEDGLKTTLQWYNENK